MRTPTVASTCTHRLHTWPLRWSLAGPLQPVRVPTGCCPAAATDRPPPAIGNRMGARHAPPGPRLLVWNATKYGSKILATIIPNQTTYAQLHRGAMWRVVCGASNTVTPIACTFATIITVRLRYQHHPPSQPYQIRRRGRPQPAARTPPPHSAAREGGNQGDHRRATPVTSMGGPPGRIITTPLRSSCLRIKRRGYLILWFSADCTGKWYHSSFKSSAGVILL